MRTNEKQHSEGSYLHAKDRFNNHEYLLDPGAYFHIQELIRFYHQSIYTLPDYEVVRARRIEDTEHTVSCTIPVNHLLIE